MGGNGGEWMRRKRKKRTAWVLLAWKQNVRRSQKRITCKLLIRECSHDTWPLIAGSHVWRCSRGRGAPRRNEREAGRERGKEKSEKNGNMR